MTTETALLQEEILKLIAANMTWEASQVQDAAGLHSMPPWLRRWLISFKEGMSRDRIDRSAVGESNSLELPEPQSRKAA